MSFHGTVSVAGEPVGAAAVFLTDEEGAVVAATRTADDGTYRLSGPAGGFLLAKLQSEVLGALALPATQELRDFALSEADVVTWSGDVVLSTGEVFDWAEVHVTPSAVEGLPDALVPLLLRTGVEPVATSTYAQMRIEQPRFTLRLMRGTYRLEVDRRELGPGGEEIDALELVALTAKSGETFAAAPIGFVLPVVADGEVTALLGPDPTR